MGRCRPSVRTLLIAVAVQVVVLALVVRVKFYASPPPTTSDPPHTNPSHAASAVPPPSPPGSAPPLSLYRESQLRTAFILHVEELQNPPDCRAAPLYVHVPTAYTSGLGSQVRGLANSMLQAVLLNRTFVADAARSVYVHPHRCPSRTYDCLFLPLSKCTLADAMADVPTEVTSTFTADTTTAQRLAHLTRASVPAGAQHPRVIAARSSCFQPQPQQLATLERQAMASDLQADPEWERLRAKHIFFENDLGDDVGPTYGGSAGGAKRPKYGEPPERHDPNVRPLGSDPNEASAPAAWWLQQLVGYVARPSDRVHRFAEELAEKMNLSSDAGVVGYPQAHVGYIGVHIRRGDKMSEAVTHETRSYAHAVRDASEALGVTSVLLATDDPTAYSELPATLKEAFRVESIPKERFAIRPTAGRVVAAKMVEMLHRDAADRKSGRSDRLQWRAKHEGDEGEMQVAQLVLLSRAASLVGTLTSNYLALAYEMAVRARHLEAEPPPALIDLDGNRYFPCSVRDAPPWGPTFGRPQSPHGSARGQPKSEV